MIGLLGSDKSEIIHYFSRVLKNLGKKVLLVDWSETKALHYSISYPMALSIEDAVIDYRGVFYTNKKEITKTEQNYDYIIADFGYELNHPEIKKCNELWIVTDPQIHHVKHLLSLELPKEMNRTLVIKDLVRGKIGKSYILNELKNLEVTDKNTYVLYFDEDDYKTAVDCQYNQVIRFDKVGREILDFFEDILSDYSEKEVKKAFKRAAKGV